MKRGIFKVFLGLFCIMLVLMSVFFESQATSASKKGSSERKTGWVQEKNSRYYYTKKGVMVTRKWIKRKGNYYYLRRSGKMAIGWITLKNKKYYFDEEGRRVTGKYFMNGKGYYFNKNGVYNPKKKVTFRVDPKKPMVALTFDDGPGPFTNQLLNTLKKNNAVATFFLVGSSISSYPSIVKRAYSMGCEIGNHTYSHPSLTNLSTTQIQTQLSLTSNLIKNLTGEPTKILRPPYGSYNSAVASTAGMPLILWSIDTRDWETLNTASTIQSVLSQVKDGDIILMHDIHRPTVIAVETIIPELYRRGFQLVTVTELAKFKNQSLKNGMIYRQIR